MVAPIPKDETAEAVFASAAQLDSFAPSGLVDLLGALLASRPSWMRDALCAEHPEVSWFPERGEPAAPAKALCQQCLVKAECRSWAVDQGASLDGVWGATVPHQRRQMRSGVQGCAPDGSVTVVATDPPGRSTAA